MRQYRPAHLALTLFILADEGPRQPWYATLIQSIRCGMGCPSCGAANLDGKKFCGDCGTPLPVRCTACGAENPPGKKFCADCGAALTDRKSTRLNSSHLGISYAVFCLKKKKKIQRYD